MNSLFPLNTRTPKNINVEVLCELPDENLKGFQKLLAWIFGLISVPDLLSSIWIVPEREVVSCLSMILKEVKPEAIYSPGNYTPLGLAVPIVNNGKAGSFILLDVSLIRKLSLSDPFVLDVISTVVEEIYHVYLYSCMWKRHGYIHHTRETFGCKVDLFVQCARVHDEYAAGRLKGEFMSKHLSAVNESGQIEPVQMQYGVSLDTSLNRASTDLEETITGAAKGLIPINEAWFKTLDIMYRGILEPLARNAGFVTANPTIEHLNNNAKNSPFYAAHIADIWQQVQIQLERSFNSNFSEQQEAIVEIVKLLDTLLRRFCVFFRTLEDGSCWVDFTTDFW